ncbi:unnamed protein product [Didymodactylos carnosus]|uniref:Uncharacterized protein n=1 Tax=Didymodactylos carnosus TaxID=1234261 RepID=A0A8S2IJ36_9BILA|nr:unnamed protein product [Didymodactylos carnosus]CAF3759023.1 unnamed protein product [Didymodactylos carnosus]
MSIYVLCALMALIPLTVTLKCYYSGPGGIIMANNCSNDTCVCVAYQYHCTNTDVSCTTQEQQTNALKWVATFNSNSTCQEMQHIPVVYINLTCCSTDLCNAYPAAGGNGSTSVHPLVAIFSMWIAIIILINRNKY